jgi:hypothetical protein
MGNRSMAAKRIKLARSKRLAPRHLYADYIPVGKPPNQLVMRELKERAKSLAFNDEYIDYLVQRKEMDRQGQHIAIGRQEVMAHIKRIQDTAPALQCVTLRDTVVNKVQMFYPSERNRFILFEDHRLDMFIRTSMVYMDRIRCINAFTSDKVRWVYFSSVSPPSDSS